MQFTNLRNTLVLCGCLALGKLFALEQNTPAANTPATAASSMAPGKLVLQDAELKLADIPDSVGRAGMLAGAANSKDFEGTLIAGGANFPQALPWEGGKKIFHDEIWRLVNKRWELAAKLPYPLAYAAFGTSDKQLLVAGGCDDKQHFEKSFSIDLQNAKITPLANLPQKLAYSAFASDGKNLYVFGGSEATDSCEASKALYVLNLQEPAQGWKTLAAIPAEGRYLSTAGIVDGKLYIFGGASLSKGADGKPLRKYLDEIWCYDIADNKWQQLAQRMPAPLVACVGPAAVAGKELLLLCGDDGKHYGKSPQTHPGQSRQLLAFDTQKGCFSVVGNWPQGLATAPLLQQNRQLLSISGETAPGVRSAKNHLKLLSDKN